jgi:hypothetical protein
MPRDVYQGMPSDNAGKKRLAGNDQEIPAELNQREAQDRASGSSAESPVDSMHVDAPKHQDNKRGHAADRARER